MLGFASRIQGKVGEGLKRLKSSSSLLGAASSSSSSWLSAASTRSIPGGSSEPLSWTSAQAKVLSMEFQSRLILGGPGTGKSTILATLAAQQAKALRNSSRTALSLNQPAPRMPLGPPAGSVLMLAASEHSTFPLQHIVDDSTPVALSSTVSVRSISAWTREAAMTALERNLESPMTASRRIWEGGRGGEAVVTAALRAVETRSDPNTWTKLQSSVPELGDEALDPLLARPDAAAVSATLEEAISEHSQSSQHMLPELLSAVEAGDLTAWSALERYYARLVDGAIRPDAYLDWASNHATAVESAVLGGKSKLKQMVRATSGECLHARTVLRPLFNSGSGGGGSSSKMDLAPGKTEEDVIVALREWSRLHIALAGGYSGWLGLKESLEAISWKDASLALLSLRTGTLAKNPASWMGPVQTLLVDDFQNVSPLHAAVINQLAAYSNGKGEHSDWTAPNVIVAGDDDQGLYAFAGAHGADNFLRFVEACPDATSFVLRDNFRSTPALTAASSWLIRHNSQSRLDHEGGWMRVGGLAAQQQLHVEADAVPPKAPIQGEGSPIQVLHYRTARAEALGVAWTISALLDSGGGDLSPSDIAILVRRLSDARPLLSALARFGVPTHWLGHKRLVDTPEVALLTSVLTMLVSPKSAPAWYNVAMSSVYSLNLVDVSAVAAVGAYARAPQRDVAMLDVARALTLIGQNEVFSGEPLTDGPANALPPPPEVMSVVPGPACGHGGMEDAEGPQRLLDPDVLTAMMQWVRGRHVASQDWSPSLSTVSGLDRMSSDFVALYRALMARTPVPDLVRMFLDRTGLTAYFNGADSRSAIAGSEHISQLLRVCESLQGKLGTTDPAVIIPALLGVPLDPSLGLSRARGARSAFAPGPSALKGLLTNGGGVDGLTANMDIMLRDEPGVLVSTIHRAAGSGSWKYVFLTGASAVRWPGRVPSVRRSFRTDGLNGSKEHAPAELEPPRSLFEAPGMIGSRDGATEREVLVTAERRAAYVALSRAEEGVFFSFADTYNSNMGPKNPTRPSPFILESLGGRKVKASSSQTIPYADVSGLLDGAFGEEHVWFGRASEALVSGRTSAADVNGEGEEGSWRRDPHAQYVSIPSRVALSAPGSDGPGFLSFSKLSMYSHCPAQYALRYVFGAGPGTGSTAAQKAGTAVHAAVAKSVDGDASGSVSALKEAWAAAGLEEDISRGEGTTGLDYEVTEAGLAAWDTREAAARQAAAVEASAAGASVSRRAEVPFEVELGTGNDDGQTVRGIWDRVDEWVDEESGAVVAAEIVEYKSRVTATLAKALARGRGLTDSMQLAMYGVAYWRKTGIVPRALVMEDVNSGKRVQYSPTERELLSTEKAILSAGARLAGGLYVATPSMWLCSRCPYATTCPAASMGRND